MHADSVAGGMVTPENTENTEGTEGPGKPLRGIPVLDEQAGEQAAAIGPLPLRS
jgi:hypothetical protein